LSGNEDLRMSTPAYSSPSTSVKSTSFEDLKQIFPFHEIEHLRQVLDRSYTMDDAVADVLDEGILSVPSSEGKRTAK